MRVFFHPVDVNIQNGLVIARVKSHGAKGGVDRLVQQGLFEGRLVGQITLDRIQTGLDDLAGHVTGGAGFAGQTATAGLVSSHKVLGSRSAGRLVEGTDAT